MLAKLGTKSDLNLQNFTYEEKLDGTRAIIYKSPNSIKIINRRNNDITHRYPDFNFLKNIKPESCVLDGEIVIFNKKGISEFNLLQHRDLLENKTLIKKRPKSMPATFVAFDILELNNKNLTSISQKKDLKFLKKIIKQSKNLKIIKSSKNGKTLFNNLTKKGRRSNCKKSKRKIL